jgi:hypothetical protein
MGGAPCHFGVWNKGSRIQYAERELGHGNCQFQLRDGSKDDPERDHKQSKLSRYGGTSIRTTTVDWDVRVIGRFAAECIFFPG